MARPFIAKYKTECSDCEDMIFPGEEIVNISGDFSHVDCVPDVKLEGKVCDICWLVHPEGACDRG